MTKSTLRLLGAALCFLLFLTGWLNAAPLMDFGTLKPTGVSLHTPEKRKQSAESVVLDGWNALQVNWDCSNSNYFEFSIHRAAQLPDFLTAKIRIQAYIPANVSARNLNLRLTDKDGEIFQFGKPLPTGKTGWQELVYEINARTPKAGIWGAGDKANKAIDLPVRLSGVAADFNRKEGSGFLAFGAVEFDVLTSDLPLQPALETGSPVHVLTPEWEGDFGVVIDNNRAFPVQGELKIRVRDAFGTQMESNVLKVSLAAGERHVFPIEKPSRFGVYYVETDYRESNPEIKPFEKEFRFSYMQPAGPTPGMAKGFLFGVCSHPGGSPVETQKLEALAAALCGIKIMRTDIYWERIQPTPEDKWNFSHYDTVVNTFGEQNIEVQAIYCYVPQWAKAKDWKPFTDKFNGKPRPEYEAWRKFIQKWAEHYRGKVRYVEVWNEPDHFGFANFSVDEYIEMMKIAYSETKKIDSDMIVLTGGYTCYPADFGKISYTHMPRTLVEGKGYYNIHAFHGHGTFRNYRNQIEKLIKLRAELGVTEPWYANETAISSIHIGEMEQAITLYQKFLYSWARGAMGYNWYDLRNDGFNPKENEHNFGLITRDFYPKAAYGVYNMLARQFSEGEYLSDANFGSAMTGYFFRNASGDLLIPHWSEVQNKRPRTVMISGVTGTVTRVDLFGNEEVLKSENGTLVLDVNTVPATLRIAGQSALPKIEGEFIRQTEDFVFRPGQRKEYQLELINPTAKRITYQLAFTLPEGLKLRNAPVKVVADPGKTTKLALTFDVADNFRSFSGMMKEVKLTLTAGGLWTGEINYPVHSIAVLGRQLSERPDFVLNLASQTAFLATNDPSSAHLFWKGPEDLSAEVRLGYDKENLLVKIDVKDDIHHQPYTGAAVWMGDNIQMAFKLPKQNSMWEIGLTRLADGKPEVYLWIAPEKTDAKKVTESIKLETTRNDNLKVTTYFVRIPFHAIGLNEKIRQEGFRFNLLVNDNDGEIRETYIAIAPGIGDSKSPELYPVVLFDK